MSDDPHEMDPELAALAAERRSRGGKIAHSRGSVYRRGTDGKPRAVALAKVRKWRMRLDLWSALVAMAARARFVDPDGSGHRVGVGKFLEALAPIPRETLVRDEPITWRDTRPPELSASDEQRAREGGTFDWGAVPGRGNGRGKRGWGSSSRVCSVSLSHEAFAAYLDLADEHGVAWRKLDADGEEALEAGWVGGLSDAQVFGRVVGAIAAGHLRPSRLPVSDRTPGSFRSSGGYIHIPF